MTLLRAKFVKNSVIWARIYFIFLKNVLQQHEILLYTIFGPQ